MSSAQINQVPTASAFTPLAVPGCALWLDGADQTSMTLNQSTLTNWRDKSGNGYMALSFSNAVAPPTWVAGIQNGRGVVQYAVGNGSFVSSFTITPAMTVFALYYPIGQTTNSPPIEQSVNSALNPGFLLQAAANNFTIRGSIPGPSNLVLSNVTMTWNAYTGAQTYTWTLYESTVGTTGPWTQINTAATASTSAAHTPMTIGNYYYFTVIVTTATGVSPPNASTPAQLVSSALLAPTNLSLTIPAGTSATATLAWTGSAGATTYSWILFTSATAAYVGTLLTSGSTAGTSATYGITIGSYNYFSVRAVTSALISAAAFSAIVGQQIVPPTGLAISASGTTVTMSWSAYTAATSYAWTLYSNSIYAYGGSQVTTGTVTGSPPATTATYSSAVAGTYYYFTLTVTTPGGTGYTSGPATSSILQVVLPTSIVATGGTSSTSPLGFTVYTFTTSATWTLTSPASFTAQTLVVGGGGGGGGNQGGAGGAGAALYNSNFAISSGSYSVTVGLGGATTSGGGGLNGGSSIFSSFTAVGGGGGGAWRSGAGSNGGCAGSGAADAGISGTPSVGFGGGACADRATGGGGGMGSAGSNAIGNQGGAGGLGLTYTLGGSSYLVCGGGGGQSASGPTTGGAGGSGIGGTGGATGISPNTNATNPTPNTGSGGGGGNYPFGNPSSGATGIVVIAIPPQVVAPPTNPTLTTSGTAATMSWAAAAGATGYSWTLYQSSTNAYAGTVTASGTTTTATTATASTVTPGLYGYFTVAATIGAASSPAVASAVVYQLPAPPSSLAVTQTGTSIVISWGAVASATAYVWTLYSNTIYAYAGSQVATGTLTGNPPTTSYTYSSAVSGTYYYFTVNVTTALGTSIVATSLPAQYTAPVIPTVTATNPSSATITPTIANGYYTYQFTATGTNTFTLTSPSSISAQALVVGGGGAGGDANPGRGGGGGAGGAVLNTISLSSGSYSVIVGGGGNPGFNGVSSSFNGIIGTGGGTCGSNGGCGGGAIYLNPSVGLGSQGGNGGTSQTLNTPPYGTGGGGGMGGNGSNVVDGQGSAPYGVGGPGITYTVGGSSYTVSGGGGGAIGSGSQYVLGGTGGGGNGGYSGISGTPGTANTGGGGGGSWGGTTGGSGIVVIAFPLLATPTSPTLTTSGTAATMSWTAAAGATGYSWTLYQSATNTYAGTVTATGTTTTATTASASTVTPGQYGYFTVAATSGGSSPAVASSVVYQLPAPPSSLVITPSGTSVAISWGAVSGATTYTYTLYSNTIYAYTGSSVATASTASTSYTYSSAVSGTYYYFTVNVTTSLGTSIVATSSIIQYITPVIPTVTATNPSSATITPTIANGYYTYQFIATGTNTFTLTSPSSISAQALVVGGGGGGGDNQGGGGGAGAALYNSNFAIASGSYSVTVGTGGSSGWPSSNGASSIFSSLTAVGGGGGGAVGSSSGANGGCGGGAGGIVVGSGGVGSVGGNGGTTFNPGGNSYGIICGGGGGMGGNGGNATSSGGGQGGAGQTFSLGGNSYLVGGGGGGLGAVQVGSPAINPGAGGSGIGGTGALTGPGGYVATQPVANTGSGGGGGNGSASTLASAGATGIVVIAIPPQVVTAPTNPTLTTSGTAATMSWTAAAGATGYSWNFYQSATNAYAGTVTATGTTTSALTASVSSGLTFGNYYYFTVAATASGSSPAVASSVVQYIPAPYNLTLSVISSGATLSWSATGTSPTFYYTLTQTTVNAYTGGTQTTIVSSNTTSTSVTYNFTSVLTNYYFFTVYQVTSAYGQSPTYQSSIFNYVWIPTAAAIPLAMWVRGNSGLNTSGGTWTDPNSSTSYTISGTATTVTVNGLSACQFTSGSGTLSNVSVSFSSSARSVFAVIQMPTSLNGATVYMVSGPFAVGNNTMDFRWYANSSTTAQISGTYQGTAILANSTAFTQLPGVPVLYGMVSSSSGTTYYINGTSIGTASAALWVAGGSTLTLNGYTPANTNGNNIFCEVVVYNGALGATDITNCMTYLRNKWGTS